MRQGAGLAGELAIGHAALALHHGHHIGCAPGLGGDQPVDRRGGARRRRRGAPLDQDLVPLRGGEQRHLRQRGLRPGPRLGRELGEVAEPALDGGPVEQVGVEGERAFEGAVELRGGQRKVDLRGPHRQGDRRAAQRAEPERDAVQPQRQRGELGAVRRSPVEGEHRLEQWRAAGVAVRQQALDQERERQRLVLQRPGHRPLRPAQQVPEAATLLDLGADRQRVDEVADGAGEPGRLASQRRHADQE